MMLKLKIPDLTTAMDRQYWLIGLILVIGGFVSYEFYNFTREAEFAEARLVFEEQANNRLTLHEQAIIAEQEAVGFLAGLFEASRNVSPEEFKIFTHSALERFPAIQALEWIPRVPASQRSAFEEAMRKDGVSGFRFSEISDEGKVIAAGQRSEYFPVYYLEPHEGNQDALGYDLGSNLDRRATLEKARDTGRPAVSGKIDLIQGGPGTLYTVPVYGIDQPVETIAQRRQHLRGFVLGVINIEKLVESTYETKQSVITPAGIDVYFYDDGAPMNRQLLHVHSSRSRNATAPVLTRAEAMSGPHIAHSFSIGGRAWTIVTKPIQPDFAVSISENSWAAALLPALITVILAAYIHALISRSRHLENENRTRRRIEETLRDSEEQFRETFDKAPHGMALVSLDERYIKVNRILCHITGYDEKELLSLDIASITHPNDKARDEEGIQALLDGKIRSHHVEKRYIRKDGDEVWINVSLVLIRNVHNEPLHFVSQIEDITERKRAEEALQKIHNELESKIEERTRSIEEARNYLDSVITNISEGIVTIDSRGIMKTVNPTAMDMFAYEAGELIGKNVSILLPEHERTEHDDYIKHSEIHASRIINQARDLSGRRKDGSLFPMELNVSPMEIEGEKMFTGIMRDITERKNAEAEIASIARFPQENPSPILRVNAEGKIIYANGAAGIFATEKAREDSRCDPGGWSKLLALARGRKAATNVEVACGSRVFSFVVSPSETSDDVNLYGLDITQRKQAETNLKAAKIEAENANHAKSQFLSSMSHELRTPLNSILGFSQILVTDKEAPLNQDQEESVDQIIASGKHLLELINDVLDLSRIESKKIELSIEDVDIGQLVDETASLIQAQAESSGIAIHRETTGLGAPLLKADYTKLKQVLLNLLSNAVKYNREGGEVSLVPERREDGKIRINVRDTGDGISENQLSGLFEPFNRLGRESSAIEGTGIGLTITKRLVEAMKGEIGVDSVPGEGSTFWVEFDEGDTLEQELDAVLDSIECTPADVTAQEKRIKVLYVEDNPANMKFVRKVISRLPQFDLLEATTAEDGLEAVFSQNPDIVLMDINLPGADGFQVLEVLQDQGLTGHMQVIALSANAMEADIKKGLDAGFDGYLTKPVNVDKLVKVLEKAATV